MDTTTNYGLKKPAYEDGADIETLNENADAIDTELKANADNIAAHKADKNNPHGVTAAQVGAVPASQKGAVGGVATLNDNGYVMQRVGAGRKSGTPIGANSTAEGGYATASGDFSHAEGGSTTAEGNYSHAEGSSTTASGDFSHAEGGYATASGYYSHAEGGSTTASGDFSHAEGSNTTAEGNYSHAEGSYVTAEVCGSHAQGLHNKQLNGDAATFSAASDAMVIGNGNFGALSNCFRVTFDGKVYGLSAFNSSGADYSEFFEWADENPSAEDRVGHFVTLDGEKIKLANDGDYIVGITSGNPAVIGDHPSESWNSRYLRDVFGRLQYEDVVIPAHEEKDKDGNVIRTVPEHTETHFKVNPDYDPAKETEYENREKRPEWSTVGLMGKLVVIDDGTCTVNGYCKPKNGIATKADTGYRVMARLDETHIKVLMK